jgi:hypothetical protein
MAVRGRAFLSEQTDDNRIRYYKGAISAAHCAAAQSPEVRLPEAARLYSEQL